MIIFCYAGINADTILKSGWTGLMYACSVGHGDITEYLLQKGADPNFHHGIIYIFFNSLFSLYTYMHI